MFGSQILDLVIGLSFFYFIFSLVASAITEGVANTIALRANTLKKGISRMLDPNQDAQEENTVNYLNLAEMIFEHGMVKNLGRRRFHFNEKGLPSYLPANKFANAFLDSIFKLDEKNAQERANLTINEFAELIQQINNEPVKQSLLTIIDNVDDEIQAGVIDAAEWMIAIREKIEIWFDEMMERVSGWYKRSAQKIIFTVALLIALAMNIDTIMITNMLWNTPAIRAAVTSIASEAVTTINSTQEDSEGEIVTPAEENSPSDSNSQDINISLSELQDLQIIGWSPVGTKDARAVPNNFGSWAFKIIGLIITAFALTLGAPFWFDVLSKLVNLRGAGKNPAEKDKTSSPPASTRETTAGTDDKATNREINALRGTVDELQENVRDQFIDIFSNIIDPILPDKRILTSLTNFSSRKLTQAEIQESKLVLGERIIYQEVRIYEGNSLPNFLDDIGRLIKGMPRRELTTRNAITLGNHCFMGDILDPSDVNKMSWLIHELTHVWQFQSSGWEYLWKAWEAQKELKEKAYDYGGVGGLSRHLDRGTNFHDFNPEQQGQIVQDYYFRLKKNEEFKKSGKDEMDTSMYECYMEMI